MRWLRKDSPGRGNKCKYLRLVSPRISEVSGDRRIGMGKRAIKISMIR